MANWLKYVIAFVSAFALMLAFRTLAFSIHGVTGDGLAPLYKNGDRLLINRCSYGLRIEGNGLLPYSRLMRQPVERGDIVAFSLGGDSIEGLMIARCTAVPGDTIRTTNGLMTVPGLVNCAKTDHYWLEAVNKQNPIDSRHLGFIPERNIIGRVMTVLYNRNNSYLP
ncbi:MAG: signal peptidase I [Prevotella sp.]|nr:signal peptidase I [Prevotella sp.]